MKGLEKSTEVPRENVNESIGILEVLQWNDEVTHIRTG